VFKLIIALIVFSVVITASKIITKKRYEKQMIELQQRTALEVERNRIATDMHDDLGADLTYIAILGEMVIRNTRLETDTANNLSKIANSSKKVIDKMSEIIWALNSSNDSLANLISYLHKYSKDFLESKDIACFVSLPSNIPDKKLTAAFRRNIFLIFKEATNNIVKHSGTKKTELVFTLDGDDLVITLKDFGSRTQKNDSNGSGNGLTNMKNRAAENNGALEITFLDGAGTLVEYRSKI
jgi:signal transduction histidine kinase